MQDSIEKTMELSAPVSRVWRALTDHEEFGAWFRVKLDGPFVVGEATRGRITYPGYEHMHWVATVQTMEAERLFAFTWCPYGGDPDYDYSNEPVTRVEFRLEPTNNGTRLFITESGFNALPDEPRRVDALRRNSQGWDGQVKNIAAHVES